MNESTVSSKFQTDLREALPQAVVIKHADKSMIGMVDASVTYSKKTVWIEYKLITPQTKGVSAKEFNASGTWSAETVAASSPTQFDMAKRLAASGNAVYLFWVLDHAGLRKRVVRVVLWNPITDGFQDIRPTELVPRFIAYMQSL